MTETELAVIAAVVALIGAGLVTGDPDGDRQHRNLQVGGAAVLGLTLILPVAGIAAAVLGVLLIVKSQVGRGVLLLGASIVVAVLAGAFWYSVLLDTTSEEASEPTELECVDPVSYEYIC